MKKCCVVVFFVLLCLLCGCKVTPSDSNEKKETYAKVFQITKDTKLDGAQYISNLDIENVDFAFNIFVTSEDYRLSFELRNEEDLVIQKINGNVENINSEGMVRAVVSLGQLNESLLNQKLSLVCVAENNKEQLEEKYTFIFGVNPDKILSISVQEEYYIDVDSNYSIRFVVNSPNGKPHAEAFIKSKSNNECESLTVKVEKGFYPKDNTWYCEVSTNRKPEDIGKEFEVTCSVSAEGEKVEAKTDLYIVNRQCNLIFNNVYISKDNKSIFFVIEGSYIYFRFMPYSWDNDGEFLGETDEVFNDVQKLYYVGGIAESDRETSYHSGEFKFVLEMKNGEKRTFYVSGDSDEIIIKSEEKDFAYSGNYRIATQEEAEKIWNSISYFH